MFSHPNMIENTEIIDNDTIATKTSNVETNENNELPATISQPETHSDEAETPSDEKHDNELNIESSEAETHSD
ncbi:MAG: hypothetical protein ACXW2E_11805, partial [Nitrososphaeraceae archaeon]